MEQLQTKQVQKYNALNSDLGGNFTIGNQSSDTATFSGGVTIAGDLTVNGTTTYISSSNLNIGDNILELNYYGTCALMLVS